MLIPSIVLGILLAAAFAFSGITKLRGTESVQANARHLGIEFRIFRLVGGAEVLGAIGVLAGLAFAPFGIAAGAALAVLMIGAVSTHQRVHDPVSRALPAAVLGALAIAYVVVRWVSA